MKFSTVDKELNDISENSLNLITYDKVIPNKSKKYPALIFKGKYIKTITQLSWVDFFNYTAQEQEEKVQYFAAFLASLKIPAQIYIRSVPIDTKAYVKEAIEEIRNSPYIHEKIKEEMIRGLPETLLYIQKDSESVPFKKEYYLITSSKLNFTWDTLQEDKENEQSSKEYNPGTFIEPKSEYIELYIENFNRYYQEIMWYLLWIFDEDSWNYHPLTTENEIAGFLAEINNGIPSEKIKEMKNRL